MLHQARSEKAFTEDNCKQNYGAVSKVKKHSITLTSVSCPFKNSNVKTILMLANKLLYVNGKPDLKIFFQATYCSLSFYVKYNIMEDYLVGQRTRETSPMYLPLGKLHVRTGPNNANTVIRALKSGFHWLQTHRWGEFKLGGF